MAAQNAKSARIIAMMTLNKVDFSRDYAKPILDKLLCQTNEKQRATDLVFGTIRNSRAIDKVIAQLADCPIERIPAKLLNIIRIGVYELIYTPQTAQHSIVNEAGQSAKTVAGKKQVGFVNAVLRQITRQLRNRQIPLTQADIRNTLPQTQSEGCEFDTPILPDFKTSPAEYFTAAFSLPRWLIAEWLNDFGIEQTRQICFAANRKCSVYIRPNTLKTTAEDLAKHFSKCEVEFEIIENSVIKLKSPAAITNLPGFDEGLFCVQDPTAGQVVRVLNPRPDWKILDLCAAPGGKTTQLAEFTDDKAEIFATDIDAKRMEKIGENTARLGIKSVKMIAYEQLEPAFEQIGPFDAVLLDVPCSNTGVLAKRPELRHRITQKAVVSLAKTQLKLLGTAGEKTKPQGKICYSTCSIQKQENTELIKQFLDVNTDFELESERLTLPSALNNDHDGGYIAIVKRR